MTHADRSSADLIIEYFRAIDEGRATQGAELFAENGSMTALGASSTGRKQIRARLAKREAMTGRQTRHVLTSVTATPGEDRDEVRGAVLVFRNDTPSDAGGTRPIEEILVVDLRASVARGPQPVITELRLETAFTTGRRG